jgi:hypothetical protein
VARLLADVGPLRRSREFRLLFGGQFVSFLGSQLTVVAVAFQVFVLTGSSFQVGLVSLVQFPALLAGSAVGGAVADSMDRRRLLVVMQLALAGASAGLGVNATLDEPQVWPLYLLTAVAAALSGFERTAHNAAIPNVVDRSSLAAAFALWQLQAQVGLTAGPAVAGLLLGGVGLATVYFIDAASFLLASAIAAAMRPLPPEGGGTRASAASIVEGFRYLRGRRLLSAVFVIDLNAMVFGMPRALFPALGTGLYGGGPATVGLLYAAVGAGALAGSVFAGWVPAVRRQGLAVLMAVAVWGGAIAAFGVLPWLGPALVLLALAGAADVVSAVFRTTILQSTVPDALRGRMSAAHIAVVTGGPRLGDAESGAVAAVAGPRVSVVSGGLACLLGVLAVARLWPELARYRAVEDEPAAVG